MKRGSTIFLKAVTILVGILSLVLLIFWFPFSDAAYADQSILANYVKDPAVIGLYFMLVPFFVALYQVFKLLDHIEKDKVFTKASVNALKNIKYCTLAFIGFIILGEIFVIFLGQDVDRAGVLALGIYTTFILSAVSTFIAVLQRLLQRAVDLKSENDLTV